MKNQNLILLIFLLCGCQTTARQTSLIQDLSGMELAKTYLESGELYQAKKAARAHLESFPEDHEAQTLMATILSEEIARYKEVYEETVPEDWSEDQKKAEIRTWLERARTLISYKQYDDAILAAENVFRFDSQNLEASTLIDEIFKKAMQDGKHGLLMRNDIVRDEVETRVERYRTEALKRVEAGRSGEARLLVRKLLLLSPEDPVGLDLNRQLTQMEMAA